MNKELIQGIPTWWLVNMITVILPKKHPWHKRWFPLKRWTEKRTEYCKFLDLILWANTIYFVVTMTIIYFKR